MKNTKILAALIVLFAFGGGCYYLGQKSSTNPEKAMEVVLAQQNTWRPQVHFAPQNTSGRRYGVVAAFMPRFTGAALYVVFHNTTDNKTYVLQTIQERVIDGVERTVCEPPSGFYNGEYKSPLHHAVAEKAESSIDKAYRLGKPIAHSLAYNAAIKEFNTGKLSSGTYTVDRDLWETVVRETREETGLNITALKTNQNFTFVQKLRGEIDTPNAYISIRSMEISGPLVPALDKLEGDEVLHAEWISLDEFNLTNNTVKTPGGEFALKPETLSFTVDLITELRRPNV